MPRTVCFGDPEIEKEIICSLYQIIEEVKDQFEGQLLVFRAGFIPLNGDGLIPIEIGLRIVETRRGLFWGFIPYKQKIDVLMIESKVSNKTTIYDRRIESSAKRQLNNLADQNHLARFMFVCGN